MASRPPHNPRARSAPTSLGAGCSNIGRQYKSPDQQSALVDTFTFPASTTVKSAEHQIGFFAHGIICDNFTNQWIYVREANTYVAPFVTGRQIPINGSQKVTLIFQAPFGFPTATVVNGQIAYFIFTAATVSAAPGVPSSPGALVALSNVAIAVTVPGNGTSSLIAGTAGKIITLYWLALMMQAAAQTSIIIRSDGTHVNISSLGANPTYTPAPPTSWSSGYALPIGEGVEAINNTANGGPLNGGIVYTQV